ncbi:MAG TPA: hypothetical protein VNM43_00580 [Dehalococcoidia bacterium]|nr:hypothetical protein [Dehalococcoidia bacterium]
MNGIGVGFTVALGVGIGMRIGAPAGFDPLEVATSMAFYGLLSGFLVHLYQFALRGFRLPSRRR